MTTSPTRRALPGIRWWHKWIGVAVGVLLFAWTASGIVMMMPGSWTSTTGQGTKAPIDWSAVTVSPSRAVQVAGADSGGTPQRVDLQQLRDGIVYVVRFERGRTVLVDASSGAAFRITPQLASAIAKDPVPTAAVRRVDRMVRAPIGYYGKLPAYRVELDDPRRIVAYVVEATGEVHRTAWRDRLQEVLGHDVHMFQPLRRLPGRDSTREGTLITTSLIALVSITTGYWLALPRRWRGTA